MKFTVKINELQKIMELHKNKFDLHVNGYGELIITSVFWEEVPAEFTGEIEKEEFDYLMETGDINEVVGTLTHTALAEVREQLDQMDSIQIGIIMGDIFRNRIEKAII